jgi:hypothetical protein
MAPKFCRRCLLSVAIRDIISKLAPIMSHTHRCWSFAAIVLVVSILLVPAVTRAQADTAAGEGRAVLEQSAPVAASQASSPEVTTGALAAAPGKPSEVSAVPAPSDKPAGLEFNFFAAEPGATPNADSVAQGAAIDKLAQTRRHRLTVHQTLGLVTWALMGASCVVGQLNYHDLYGGGSGRGAYQLPHQLLVYPTAIMFAITGTYALLAPTPYKKPLKFDTALVHRIAAIGATAGMIAQVALGFITARQADAGNPTDLKQMAQVHAVVGWTTFGFMTAAGAAWVF